MNPVKKLNVYQKAFRLSIFAEGKGRYSLSEYVRFLAIARGSLFELQTQLDIAKEIGYIVNNEDLKITTELIIEVGKMLTAMINKIS